MRMAASEDGTGGGPGNLREEFQSERPPVPPGCFLN